MKLFISVKIFFLSAGVMGNKIVKALKVPSNLTINFCQKDTYLLLFVPWPHILKSISIHYFGLNFTLVLNS